jgi:hypothetical protein
MALSRKALLTLFGSVALAAGSLSIAQAGSGSLSQQTSGVRQKLAAEQRQLGNSVRLKPRSRELSHPGITRRVFAARVEETGDKVFARIPRYGVPGAMRRHNFARIVAEQLGWGHLIPSAGAVTLAESMGDGSIDIRGLKRDVRKGDPIMLVPDLGEDWTTYQDLSDNGRAGGVAGAFPEELRVTGAVLHLLSWQLDGNPANVMVRAGAGRSVTPKDVRIIDHDVALGVKHTGPRINGSAFYPNNPRSPELAFTSRQSKVEDLPPRARELVTSLARASVREISDAYGLEHEEAELVSKAAKDIHDNGLTKAVQRFWAESPKFHDTDYHQRKKQGR